MNSTLINAPMGLYESAGAYEVTAFRESATIPELVAEMRRQELALREAPEHEVLDALMSGRLRHVRQLGREISDQPRQFNKITDKFLEAGGIADRIIGNFTSDQDMVIRRLAVGTDYAATAYNAAGLVREIFRKAPLSMVRQGPNAKIYLELGLTEANPAVSAVIATGTNDTTTITVDDATGFTIGDAIRVSTSPAESFSRIIGIAGNVLSLDASDALQFTPAIGQAVDLCIGEVGAFGHQTANGTANSGSCFSRSRLRFYNDATAVYLVRFTYMGRSV